MASDRPRPLFRSDLEGLRGVAILLVIAFHAGVTGLAGGFVGVDVFFVLSGYLITGLLAREVIETGDVDLSSFYARRARRLAPAFLVVLVATLGLVLWLYAPIDAPSVASDARAVALHYGNMLFASQALDYHATAQNPFLHTWSLAVEEQFYFVWPLLFAFIGRFYGGEEWRVTRVMRWAVGGAAVVSLLISLVVTASSQPWAFFGMPSRIWEFAIGGLVALSIGSIDDAPDVPRHSTYAPAMLQIVGLIAVAWSATSYHEALPYPGIAAALPALGAVAIIAGGAVTSTSMVSRALGVRFLQWFGKMSYAWYLWHWPLVGLGAVLDWHIGVVGKLAWSAFALVLAVLTNRFVEEPVWRGELFGDSTSSRINVLALGASLAAALLATGALALASSRASSPAQRAFAAARVDNMNHQCWGSLIENATAPCIFGDVAAQTTVVLMGDSHAEHWLPAMDRIGRERHWKVYAMVKPACPVADVEDMLSSRLKRRYTECSEWRSAKIRRILALRPAFVVLSSYDHYVSTQRADAGYGVTPEMWYAGLRNTYGTLSAAGIKTIAMRDVPDVGFDVPSCLSRRASRIAIGSRACEYNLASGLVPAAVDAQTRAAQAYANVAIVDMNDRVCNASPCGVVRNRAIVYRDDDHLTATFSRAEAPALAARIESALAGLARR